MKTSNPAFRNDVFSQYGYSYSTYGSEQTMSIEGTVNKTLILLIILMGTAFIMGYMFFFTPLVGLVYLLTMLGFIGGFILALITIFKQEYSPITAPIYAAFEGMAIGGVSSVFELYFPGIVIQTVALTFGVLLSMLMLYRSGIIKVTQSFRMGLLAAMGAIFFVYIGAIILGFFGMQIPLIFGSGPIGIGFSVIVVIVAALSLMLDFDFIEKGSMTGAPKYMEWYGAFGLMVTLVWLYLEILRLLSKVRSR